MKRKQEPIFSILEELEIDASVSEPVTIASEAFDERSIAALGAHQAIAEADVPALGEHESVAEGDVPALTDPKTVDDGAASTLNESEPPAVSLLDRCTDSSQASTDLFGDEVFVHIPPGSVLMGSPASEPGRNNDEIQHEVTITSGFYLQRTLMTQGQWQAVMGSNPAQFLDDGEDCPVESVTWHECQELIRRLNAGGGHIYRLPTEAEWEYACRAGTATAFAAGEIVELFCGLDPALAAMGWYCGNSNRKTHPVAQKRPNAWGLFDLHGNLSEWCQDWYGEYPAAATSDPTGASSGPGRIIRGGSWFSGAKNCRSASRFYWAPHSKSNVIGFRLVRTGDSHQSRGAR